MERPINEKRDDVLDNLPHVNHPDHYQGQNMEAIDVIEDFDLNFNLGNVVKYVLRSANKGQYVVDLLKAKWYIDREITTRLTVKLFD